jgi:extradiol dioxygenase family protein
VYCGRHFYLVVMIDDLQSSSELYGEMNCCERGRSADMWIDWNLRGHQIVTHIVPRRQTAAASDLSALMYRSACFDSFGAAHAERGPPGPPEP